MHACLLHVYMHMRNIPHRDACVIEAGREDVRSIDCTGANQPRASLRASEDSLSWHDGEPSGLFFTVNAAACSCLCKMRRWSIKGHTQGALQTWAKKYVQTAKRAMPRALREHGQKSMCEQLAGRHNKQDFITTTVLGRQVQGATH